MSRNTRSHPTDQSIRNLSLDELIDYARDEADLLCEQKQTAVPRLLRELTRRLDKDDRTLRAVRQLVAK